MNSVQPSRSYRGNDVVQDAGDRRSESSRPHRLRVRKKLQLCSLHPIQGSVTEVHRRDKGPGPQTGPQRFENIEPNLTVWEIEPGMTKSACLRPRYNLPAKILINCIGPTPQQESEVLPPE